MDDPDLGEIRSIVASPRKFSAYVLVPGHPMGKDRVFLGRLGFRPMDAEDAAFLVSMYVAQARQAVEAGMFERREPTRYGIPYTIVVTVRGVALRTGWFLRPTGVLELVTPFSGYASTTQGAAG